MAKRICKDPYNPIVVSESTEVSLAKSIEEVGSIVPSRLSNFWLYIIIFGGGSIVFLAIFIPILVCCLNRCRNARKLKEQKEKEKN